MSPTSLASLPDAVRDGAERGMREAIRRELGRWTQPKVAEKVGFVTGTTILLVGYGVRRRAKRLKRIEETLAEVAEEVVEHDDQTGHVHEQTEQAIVGSGRAL